MCSISVVDIGRDLQICLFLSRPVAVCTHYAFSAHEGNSFYEPRQCLVLIVLWGCHIFLRPKITENTNKKLFNILRNIFDFGYDDVQLIISL